jgi:hypothetical protein
VKKLELRVYRDGCFVFGYTVKIPPELRGRGVLARQGKFRLTSAAHSHIYGSEELWIEGTMRINDDEWFQYTFISEEIAKTFCDNVVACVNQVNGEDRPEISNIERIL